MITTNDYIITYGIAEVIQLTPLNSQGGDLVIPNDGISFEPWLVSAVNRANELVSIYLDAERFPEVFKQCALTIARYYLHFNNMSDVIKGSYSSTIKLLGDLSDISGQSSPVARTYPIRASLVKNIYR